MARQTLIIKDFQGGIGTLGEKRDKPGTAKFTKGLDPYEDLSYVTQARIATKISSTTITGLPYWMEDGSPHTTNRYIYDSAGKIYQDASDTITSIRTVSGGAGEGLKVFDDYLYYALGTNIGRYGLLSGTPAFDDDLTSWFDETDVQTSGGGTGAADYVPPTSIAETAASFQTFEAEHDPLKEITINVDVVGSGNWTLTVHDEFNTAIGSKTIANGDMPGADSDTTFTFASPLRLVIGNDYHFHVTSTVADGGVDTDEATSLAAGAATEGAEYTAEYSVLIDTNWHPMVLIEGTDLIIGNERYLAKFDQVTYDPNFVLLDAGYEVRDIANFEEFIVAAAYKGSSVDDAEDGKIYFWDGLAASWNYSSSLRNKVPNAIENVNGDLIGVYGTKGDVYRGADPFEKIVDGVPKLTKGKKVEVYPGAITEFEGRVLIGYAGNTDDGTNFEQGVYEFGSQSDQTEFGFNYPYQVSTGTTKSTTLKIGMVKSIGNDLYIGWRDGASYGLDKITRGASALAAASYESLIIDGGDSNKEMLPLELSVTFEALTTGQSITPKYKYDRAAAYTTGTAADTVGDTEVTEGLYTRCKEIEIGLNLASTSNTFIKITEVKFEFDDLSEEKED